MAATDGQIVIAAARWSTEEVLSLKEFLSQARCDDAPGSELVKFVRGQFSNLGVPNLPNPSLNSHAVVSTLGKTLKVAAQSVKFKDGKRNCSFSSGIRFSIPESYPGYFEILSEEGKAVKCIESVLELTKKFPECVLVRENVRGFISTIPLLELSADKSRTINAGEILTLVKEVSLTSRSSRSHRFLQCTDSKDDIVYLNMEQRGKFSPIARNDNISGVHTLQQLVSNKRLPLMVRLVWGPPPVKPNGTTQPACSELRLISAFEEDSLFALPIGQHSKDIPNAVVSLPISCNLKLVRSRNHSDLQRSEHFQRLANTATRLAKDVNARMIVLETFKDNNISFWNISPTHSKHIGAKVSSKNYFLRRSISHDESQIVVTPIIPKDDPPEIVAPTQDFLEIDQIYDYVRGFAPLPKNLRSNSYEGDSKANTSQQAPQPPPIETIPTNKHHHTPTSVEKKSRKVERQKLMKPINSKTALKMELHAQNLAQGSERVRHDTKRLFKSKTTSSIADYIQLSALTETPVDIDLSTTHLLTQADLSPQPIEPDLEPTYENTTQVYLECDDKVNEINPKPKLYQKQKATSEIGHRLRETSPNLFNKCSSKHQRNKNVNNSKTSKSHEDLASKKHNSLSPASCSQPESPVHLHNSLSSLRTPTTESIERKARRRRLSKQRSLSSLLAEAAPNTPVIEHKPVELHLHLSRPSGARHHTRSSKQERPPKLGILYL